MEQIGRASPVEQHGWTLVRTMGRAPELHSLFDADGELVGEVCQRFGRVTSWAPFTWAEVAYHSEGDIGEFAFESEAQRQRHFARIGKALHQWARRKREAGVDIPQLRDTHAYRFGCIPRLEAGVDAVHGVRWPLQAPRSLAQARRKTSRIRACAVGLPRR